LAPFPLVFARGLHDEAIGPARVSRFRIIDEAIDPILVRARVSVFIEVLGATPLPVLAPGHFVLADSRDVGSRSIIGSWSSFDLPIAIGVFMVNKPAGSIGRGGRFKDRLAEVADSIALPGPCRGLRWGKDFFDESTKP